ncbi:alanine--tRNA ligase [bacterium]|nr:alanine--tRNA ligase [bacterium]
MTSAEIRQAFIDFFAAQKHTIVPSSPVIPQDDPTLLFINAGMNQFKDVFLGTGTREYSRAVDSQKCIRVSGKHNDLEEVGPSPNHHTFFEMLGNWSFGDYYKAEAIRWAWELMTEVYKLPADKLYATVFTDDDEAHRLWESETSIDPSHISRHGHKDNFWEMGEVGPCGPCTELHIDLGKPAPGRQTIENDGPNTESGRFVELWNLVFIQYHRDKSGELHNLPATHVDTGAGLERIARVMQGVESNYETDVFSPIISEIAERSGVAYELNGIHIPHRVIADHLRALTFAIADGGLPGNEGRGYVLRRILRRASRFVRELGVDGPFVHTLVPVLVDVMGHHFSEIKERQQHIQTVIRAEEESFLRTLDNGLTVFGNSFTRTFVEHANKQGGDKLPAWAEKLAGAGKLVTSKSGLVNRYVAELDKLTTGNGDSINYNYIDRNLDEFASTLKAVSNVDAAKLDELVNEFRELKAGLVIPAADAFKLYDTYGFPLDLTQQMARERGIEVDTDGFDREMAAAKERSRAGQKFVQGETDFETVSEGEHSVFTGYDSLRESTELRLARTLEEDGETKYALVLAKTPFYAESGGQVCDYGSISGDGWEFQVYDVRNEGDRRVHYATVAKQPDGSSLPVKVTAHVDEDRRGRILPHHTTTHLLQAALRDVLGEHVTQAGSAVGPEKMTFDFTHFEKPSEEQLARAEAIVNEAIRRDYPVTAAQMPIDEAKSKGAMALFGEKYDDVVRVITVGDDDGGDNFSMELCGGTHLTRTGEAGLFRIESETGLSAGVRRVECTAGAAAYERMQQERDTLDRVISTVGSGGSDPADKIAKLLDRQKEMQKEIERLQRAALQGSVDMLTDWGHDLEFKGAPITAVFAHTDAVSDKNGLQQVGDKIIEKLTQANKDGFGIVGATMDKTYMFVAVVTPGLIKQGLMAGKLVGAVAKTVGGGGGGKPDFATAGAKDVDAAKSLISDRAGFVKTLSSILESL